MQQVLGVRQNHLFSVYFAPRGSIRMYELGNQIAQQYLTPTDRLIGLIGEAGSGKSMFIKGMFPGLELTNDDDGLNVRPLPIMDIEEGGFFKPHTYHLDIRFETGFHQLYELADAINNAIAAGRRVVVEHFELIYPILKRNANLLIGVGAEIIVTRPTIFGPEPQPIADRVHSSVVYRKMAHSAEDLLEILIPNETFTTFSHGDVRHGFIISFPEKPDFNIKEMEQKVLDYIAKDISIQYIDERHIKIGDIVHPCTGPRTHVSSTGQIEQFRLLDEFFFDPNTNHHILVGLVGEEINRKEGYDINKVLL